MGLLQGPRGRQFLMTEDVARSMIEGGGRWVVLTRFRVTTGVFT